MHQVGTSSLLIYMMHGHTYIKFNGIASIKMESKKLANFYFPLQEVFPL